MYTLDIYSSNQLVGSVGVQDGKLVYEGDVAFVKELCAEVGSDPVTVLAELPKRFRGQGLYTRPHGATAYLGHIEDKPAT